MGPIPNKFQSLLFWITHSELSTWHCHFHPLLVSILVILDNSFREEILDRPDPRTLEFQSLLFWITHSEC